MKVSTEKWLEVADNLKRRRDENPITPNMELYKNIVNLVHIGTSILDVGAGQCYLYSLLKEFHIKNDRELFYYPIDPYPVSPKVYPARAEELGVTTCMESGFDTVFMLAALDNVQDVELALKGLKKVASENIVILTGIDIEPDQYHTHKITRQMLVDVLGEPSQEIEMLPKVFLFEWKL